MELYFILSNWEPISFFEYEVGRSCWHMLGNMSGRLSLSFKKVPFYQYKARSTSLALFPSYLLANLPIVNISAVGYLPQKVRFGSMNNRDSLWGGGHGDGWALSRRYIRAWNVLHAPVCRLLHISAHQLLSCLTDKLIEVEHLTKADQESPHLKGTAGGMGWTLWP